MNILYIGLLLGMILAYLRTSLPVWILAFTLLLVAVGMLTNISIVTISILSIALAVVIIMIVLLPIRRKIFSLILFRFYKKQLPAMSSTEAAALEAGTVGWDADLFSGKPDWKKLHDITPATLSKEEQDYLDGPVQEFCNMLNDWKITNHDYDLPKEAWDYLKQNKFFAMIIPKKFGGLEFSAKAHSDIVLKISTRSITAAVTVMVPNSLGPGMLLMEYATEAQKKYYLPRLASGEEIPCFALTSPEAGSDAGGMNDFGVVCRGEYEGKKDVLGIRVTWNKRYITLGPIATLLGLAFKLYDPEHLLGDEENIGITLALIPTSHPGVNIGRRHYPVNVPFQNGPNSGDDVFIPMDWIIGGVDQVGQGWPMLMECLSDGRGISLPALSTGAGKLASRTTGAYARLRRQFNVPIGDFEGVQEVLARIAGLTYIMNAARDLTLSALDQGEKPSVITAIIKYHLTESMRTVINDAMDVHGGKAIMMGPKNYIANSYISIPIGITVEGANILTRNMIIFGQGAIRCHPYVLQEIHAVAEKDAVKALVDFDKAIFGHIGFIISNAVRTFILGLTNGKLHRPFNKGKTNQYYQQAMRMSSAFALLADVSMIMLGGTLKRKENLSARLGDSLSNLYLLTASLKHFQEQGSPVEDEVLMEWSCQTCLNNIQEAMDGFLLNFPNRYIATVMRWLVFPFGRSYHKANDKLSHAVSRILLEPSESRDRLTQGMFIPDNKKESVKQLEDALSMIIKAEPLMNKIIKAMHKGELESKSIIKAAEEAIKSNLINKEEGIVVREAIQMRDEIIAVDDFEMLPIIKKEEQWESHDKAVQSI
jgi:acyl-CoA dehydrogenase